MNKLTITITITDPDLLAFLENYSEDKIVKVVLNHQTLWLDGAEIEVEKE
jgi:hypothetical protein